jgi:hypothetical protein
MPSANPSRVSTVAPGVHEQWVETTLMCGNAQPAHVTVDALQFSHYGADVLCAFGISTPASFSTAWA